MCFMPPTKGKQFSIRSVPPKKDVSYFEERELVQADNMQLLLALYQGRTPFLSTFLRVLQAFWSQKNPEEAQKYNLPCCFFTSHFWTDSGANSGRRKSFSWYNLVGRQRETRAHWGDVGLPKKTSKSNRHPSSTYTGGGCDLHQRLHWCLHECILTMTAAGRARAGKLAWKLPRRGTEGLHSTTTLWIHVFTQANSNDFQVFRLAHLQHGQNRNRDTNSLLSCVCLYIQRSAKIRSAVGLCVIVRVGTSKWSLSFFPIISYDRKAKS